MSFHFFCRSATAAALAQVVPAFRSPFSNLQTRAVTMPLRRCIPLLISTSTPMVDSLNVRRVSCGGDLMSLGAPIYRSSVIARSNRFRLSRHVLLCRTPYFYGIIPGGTAFPIHGPLSSYNGTGTALNWTVDMVPGTTLSLVGSDGRGIGSGGYAEFVISSTSNSSCLNDNSPSSTPGNPAGSYPTGSHPTGSYSTGSYPTGPSSPSTSDGRHSSS